MQQLRARVNLCLRRIDKGFIHLELGTLKTEFCQKEWH